MSATRPFAPVAARLALGLLIAGHLLWMFRAFGGAFSSPDAAGYLLQARQLATAGTTAIRPSSPAEALDLHYLDVGGGEFRSRYPPGLPALQALPYRLGGVPAALAVNPLLAALGGLLLFLLARRWAGLWPALLAVLLYATLPVLNEQALMGTAHVPVATALLGALLALDRWSERPTPGRGLALGALLGVLPALRYPAAVPALAVTAVVALRCARSTEHRRTAWAAALAFAALVGALLAHNAAAYGFPLATGYGLTGEDSAFGLHYFRLNAPGYLTSIRTAAGPLAAFGTAGILAMLARPASRARGSLLLVLVGAPTLLYMSYYWSLTGPRFLLPGFALLVLAAACFLARLRPRILGLAAALALTGWHLAGALPGGLSRMERLRGEIARGEAVLDGLRERVARGSVLIAPLSVRLLAAPSGEWKLVETSLLWPGRDEPVTPPLPDPPPGRSPVSPWQADRAAALRAPYRGFDADRRVEAVLEELLRWSVPDGQVFFLGDPMALRDLEPHRARLGRFVYEGALELPSIGEAGGGSRAARSGEAARRRPTR